MEKRIYPTLYRLGGLALVVAAVLHVIYWPLHPPGHDLSAQLDPGWGPAHLVGFVSALLLVLGFPAVYLRQADRIGWMGHIGAALTYLQSLLLADVLFFETLITPVLAADPAAQALTDTGGVLAMGPLSAAHSAVVPAFMLVTSLALVLFGLATARAGVLPRGGAVLVAIGGAMIVGGPVSFLFAMAGSVVRLLGFGWLGWALLRSPGPRPAQAGARTEQPI